MKIKSWKQISYDFLAFGAPLIFLIYLFEIRMKDIPIVIISIFVMALFFRFLGWAEERNKTKKEEE